MIAVSLLEEYHVFGIALSWVSAVSLLLSSISSIRSVIVSSIVFVSVIVISICSVLYTIFLFIRISGTLVFWFTCWNPVFFKPLLFRWIFLYGFKLSCLTLFSPLFLHYYYNFFIEITLYQVFHFIINLFYRF